MLDIRWIRDNPEAFDKAMQLRDVDVSAQSLIELDDKRRAHVTRLQEAQEERNKASKEIGKAKASGDEAAAQKAIAEVAKVKSFLQTAEDEEKSLTDAVTRALEVLPNIPFEDVPVGAGENDNVEVRLVGEKPTFDFSPKEHFELGEALGGMDFEAAAKIAGSRFAIFLPGSSLSYRFRNCNGCCNRNIQ